MDGKDDVPPLLVTTDELKPEESRLSADLEDVKLTKVPITIITGR